MELNFHKIHSLFSSIDHLIVTNNMKEHGAQMFKYLNMNLLLLGKKLPKGDTNSIFWPKFPFLIKKIAKFFLVGMLLGVFFSIL
jgi:hypothetical protein